MKRSGKLWPQLISWPNLLESARLAARGKRQRPDVARFLHELEGNLCRLQSELREGLYQPAGYRTFWIHDPKPRLISAAPFRDRVVHHALTRVLEPCFERRFTAFSFASRQGYGQHRALALARDAVANHPYVLKGDIQSYFPSIDHPILGDLLRRVIKCAPTLQLAHRIIAGSNPQVESVAYFPGDDLFTPFQRRRGLPIGNQTSQFFANVYLNPFDHFVLRELRPALYVRYVDDFLLFGDDRCALLCMAQQARAFLETLRLRVNPRKFQVQGTADGVTFLGWRLRPGLARLVRANVVRARRRFRQMQAAFHEGTSSFDEIQAGVQAWLGHARFGDTVQLRRQIFDEFILNTAEHGRSAARRRLEQQSNERARLEP